MKEDSYAKNERKETELVADMDLGGPAKQEWEIPIAQSRETFADWGEARRESQKLCDRLGLPFVDPVRKDHR